MPATMPAKRARGTPEWQAAQAEYLADDGDPEEVLGRRILAAYKIREIERAFEARQQR